MKWSELKKRIDEEIESQNPGDTPIDPEIDDITVFLSYVDDVDVDITFAEEEWQLMVSG